MKASVMLRTLRGLAAATNSLSARADCSCSISKCPPSDIPTSPQHCVCVTSPT
ncbi:hypothetical protein BDU57DRAFT_580415 [Ampelomyces quisqualis]|uniref:Uncharacterized protein n=1 Tax=Ampelomyces quisqualis TaxID=50730 RepID=A0A6A5QGA9_AMPQU|nr:hypothetical protein BDU57DRAFT_580415 [Ampelomyces quisqualis]